MRTQRAPSGRSASSKGSQTSGARSPALLWALLRLLIRRGRQALRITRRELLGAFHRFQPRDTIAWFAERGVVVERVLSDNGGCAEVIERGTGGELGCTAQMIAAAYEEKRTGAGPKRSKENSTVPPSAETFSVSC